MTGGWIQLAQAAGPIIRRLDPMPKKHKRSDRHKYREAMHDPALPPEQPDNPPPLDYGEVAVTPPAPETPAPAWESPLAETLEAIRSNAAEARRNNAQTISELESWRAEIDAAIAFLKTRA
jgi:hypothetical protein